MKFKLLKREIKMSLPKLTLYVGNGCPYCKRVTDFLETHPMNIEIKEVWSNEAAAAELMALTGKGQVPCLKMDDEYMHESLDIIEKLKVLENKE